MYIYIYVCIYIHIYVYTYIQERISRIYSSSMVQSFIALIIGGNFVATAAELQVYDCVTYSICKWVTNSIYVWVNNMWLSANLLRINESQTSYMNECVYEWVTNCKYWWVTHSIYEWVTNFIYVWVSNEWWATRFIAATLSSTT